MKYCFRQDLRSLFLSCKIMKRDYREDDLYSHVEKYFRLIHYSEKILKPHQSISDVNIAQNVKDLII